MGQVMFFRDVQSAHMIRADNAIRTLAGSDHWIMLRKFSPPTLDPIWKEDSQEQQAPLLEFAVLAKIRALSENEMVSTEVGIVKKGDLFVMVDAGINVVNLDEMRFKVDTQLDGGLGISNTWDYTIYEVKRTDFGANTISKTFMARRKLEQTKGGSRDT
jgi:hypothetical protein